MVSMGYRSELWVTSGSSFAEMVPGSIEAGLWSYLSPYFAPSQPNREQGLSDYGA